MQSKKYTPSPYSYLIGKECDYNGNVAKEAEGNHYAVGNYQRVVGSLTQPAHNRQFKGKFHEIHST